MKSHLFSPPRPPPTKRNSSGSKRAQQQKTNNFKKEKNKSVELGKRKRKVSLEVKTNFKISSDHMGFLIQEQKANDLATIRSSVALNHYYQSLMSLFAVTYSSSQIITSNLFENQKMSTGLSGLKFVGVLFSIYEHVWNEAQHMKLRVMAKNVMKMGSTARIFQEKVQFICRKITLNYNMRKRIEMAFLNTNLDSFWKFVFSKFKLSDQIEFLEDLYENAPQKMAYWDFSYFINNFLAHEDFYETLKQHNKCRRVQLAEEDTLPHNFTYEFLIIEIFCFHQQQAEREEDQARENRTCQII